MLKNILQGVVELFNGAIELIGGQIGAIYTLMVSINNKSDFVSGAVLFTTTFSISLVAFKAVVQYLDTYVFEVNYDPDEDPFNYAIRVAQCTAFISCNGWIFNTLFKFSDNFYNDLIGSTGSVSFPTTFTGLLATVLVDPTGKMAAYAFVLCGIIIAFVINAIAAAKRGGEITLMKIAAPIFYTDLLTTNRERFNNFFIGYVFTFITYSIQMFCFIMSLKAAVGIAIGQMSYAWVTIAWLWLSLSSPKFIEKYIYKTGVGSSISGGLRTGAQILIMRGR